MQTIENNVALDLTFSLAFESGLVVMTQFFTNIAQAQVV